MTIGIDLGGTNIAAALVDVALQCVKAELFRGFGTADSGNIIPS